MASRSQRKLWRALRRRKGRERHGLYLVEGPNAVSELLDAGAGIEDLLHTSEARTDPDVRLLLERAERDGIPVLALPEGEFAELADTVTPRGILAVARIPRWGWQDLRSPRILVLDAVQDPGNLGTLVRTAEALGLGGLVCLAGTVEPWNPKVVRAAAGCTVRVPILRAEWPEAAARLRERGARIWAADAGGRPFERDDDAPERLALVLGNEASGVSAPVLAEADRTVSVPMAGRVESLNVAVAGAILMDRIFAARRDRPYPGGVPQAAEEGPGGGAGGPTGGRVGGGGVEGEGSGRGSG